MNTLSLGALTLLLAQPQTTPVTESPSLAHDTVTLAARREPGLTLTRTIENHAELAGRDLAVTMDGQEVPAEYLPELTLAITTESTVQVVDTHTPRALVRRFEALAQEAVIELDLGGYMGQSGERTEASATSALEGRAVRFAPSDDGGTVATFVAAEVPTAEPTPEASAAERALLAGLRADLDLAAWLPATPVAVGERWHGPADALRELMEPSGELAWRWSAPDADDHVDGRTITGDVELELVRVTASAGRSLATLRVSGTFEHTTTRATDLADVPVTSGTAIETRTARTTLRGELTWDVAGGHLAAAELTAEVEQQTRTVKDPGQEGPAYESTLSFDGTERWQVSVARGDG